jgi:hypothetical protein
MRERGTSAKPCPGCGEKVWHPVSGVCHTCRDTLEAARHQYTNIQALLERKEGRLYFFAMTAHWNPYLSGGRDAPSHEVNDPYQEALRDLVLAAALEVRDRKLPLNTKHDGEYLIESRRHESGQDRVILKPQVAEAIRALDAWVREVLPKVYEAGKHEGSSILKALQAGRITADAYDKERSE